VLFVDASWLALDKPSAMLTTPPASRGTTLVDYARRLRPKAAYHHPLSRLDAGVSGVVLFALDARAIACAEEARTVRRYRRLYVGLTAPSPSERAGRWSAPIEGREACTHYEVLAEAGGVALVGFVPLTGRTHQIRVHAQGAGAPLFGDLGYGGARRVVGDDGAVSDARRVMLHAWRVCVPGREHVIEAPLHGDFCAAWQATGGGDATEQAQTFGTTLTRAFAEE
jgi:23S rRNA-/tRNA-specific pseudouridylate synthase